ncbi:MAG: 4a-hydroxytetrahydrobiopterin dehydratase [Hyphomicrobiales bacterium]|nr:4a-hydroxytetrahydrobiopterin dehydratase [Hyphomicrobiales bacterium]
MAIQPALAPVDVAAALARGLPRWRLDGKAIRRVYRVQGFKSALMLVNAIGHLCEAAWHHPDLALSWGRVEVSLWSHDADGVTARDLELARRIEDLATWRPGAEGGALEGTPADPQHAYLLDD